MNNRKSTGIDLIAERRRQQVEKGYTAVVDSHLPDGSLAMAAICYAMDEPLFMKTEQPGGVLYSDPWPFEPEFDRRVRCEGSVVYDLPLQDRIDQLAKAGALIAAEIDNLQFKNTLCSLSPCVDIAKVVAEKRTKAYFAEPEDDVNTYDESRLRSSTGFLATATGTIKKPAF